MRIRYGHWAAIALTSLCISCGGPLELVEKSDQLDAEIADLKQELADVGKQPKGGNKDVTRDFEAAELKLEELSQQEIRLNSDLAKLRDDKRSLESRFDSYRRKHPIR